MNALLISPNQVRSKTYSFDDSDDFEIELRFESRFSSLSADYEILNAAQIENKLEIDPDETISLRKN